MTSVPLACPAAGCTTMPAGLSTTIRSLVLVDDRQRQSFGLRRRRRSARGRRSTISCPVLTGWFAFAARPATSTRPSLISRWICDRDWSAQHRDEEAIEPERSSLSSGDGEASAGDLRGLCAPRFGSGARPARAQR